MGKAIASELVHRGAVVYGLGRTLSKLEAVRAELNDSFKPIVLDVARRDLVQNWVNDTFSEVKTPDILINNAGVGYSV